MDTKSDHFQCFLVVLALYGCFKGPEWCKTKILGQQTPAEGSPMTAEFMDFGFKGVLSRSWLQMTVNGWKWLEMTGNG